MATYAQHIPSLNDTDLHQTLLDIPYTSEECIEHRNIPFRNLTQPYSTPMLQLHPLPAATTPEPRHSSSHCSQHLDSDAYNDTEQQDSCKCELKHFTHPFYWWSLRLIPNYITVLILLGIWYALKNLHPIQPSTTPDPSTNPEVQYPIYSKEDIINDQLLVFIAYGLPVLAHAILSALAVVVYTRFQKTRPLSTMAALGIYTHTVHTYALALGVSVLMTSVVTDCLKVWVGRLRPDFAARCQWSAAIEDCTGNARMVAKGRRSFPSGHSSNAFSGMTFLALWVAYMSGLIFHSSAKRFNKHISWEYVHITSLWIGKYLGIASSIIPFAPMLLATYVATSRIEQHVHHPTDVITGGVIGMVVAWWTFKQLVAKA
ncbi:hypothetical protein BDV3_004952 [Batrachochytrium dendrobatidis]|nr:hypothetical protein O5D80_006865 [Batrachochytrium dendrobatidis]KAK5670869.1 hypothetical protein QVD99_002639 [Batrachochytrium dendrobatidis]OAJ40458.1 hypothetical protein BDEG_24191 [Batrachochytrium dendrobatidis JEL423]